MILTRIHKTSNPGSPIVTSNDHPTGYRSRLTICLSGVKNTTVTFLTNSLTLLLYRHTCHSRRFIEYIEYIVSPVSHTTKELIAIDACRRLFDTRSDKHIPTETLCDLLRIILLLTIQNNF